MLLLLIDAIGRDADRSFGRIYGRSRHLSAAKNDVTYVLEDHSCIIQISRLMCTLLHVSSPTFVILISFEIVIL